MGEKQGPSSKKKKLSLPFFPQPGLFPFFFVVVVVIVVSLGSAFASLQDAQTKRDKERERERDNNTTSFPPYRFLLFFKRKLSIEKNAPQRERECV